MLGAADVFLAVRITQSDTHAVLIEPECCEDDLHEFKAALHFRVELVFGDEEVGIILREATHARHAAELA